MRKNKGTSAPPGEATRPSFPFVPIEELERRVDELCRNVPAKTIPKSYSSDWARWLDFCEHNQINPIPAEAGDVHRYLRDLGIVGGSKGAKLKPRAAQRRLAAIAAGHQVAGLVFDMQHPILKETMDGIHGARKESAQALRAEDIAAICATFGPGLRSVRDKAIILLGFAGGFRRSEIVALNVGDLEFEAGMLRIRRRRSQAVQKRRVWTTVIKPSENPKICAIAGVRAWLRAADIEHENNGPVFRPVERHGGVKFARLSDETVNLIVKSAARAAGLKLTYSAQSLRAGHIMEALNGLYSPYSVGL